MRCRIYCKKHGSRRPCSRRHTGSDDNDDGFTWGAESIVKQTVLEAHAHGDTPRRSGNETRRRVHIATEAGPECRKSIAKQKAFSRQIGPGAESIVKNTVLEAHAHGDTRPVSDNEPDG